MIVPLQGQLLVVAGLGQSGILLAGRVFVRSLTLFSPRGIVTG